MKKILWVIVIVIVSTTFFGENVASILSAIFFAFAPSSSKKSDALKEVQPLSKNTNRKSAAPIFIFMGIVCFLSTVFVALWWWNDQPEIQELPLPQPLPLLVDARSSSGCLKENFGDAISKGLAVPPEVRVFCNYSWDAQKLDSIAAIIKQEKVTLFDLVKGEKNVDDAKIKEFSLANDYVESVRNYDLSRTLSTSQRQKKWNIYQFHQIYGPLLIVSLLRSPDHKFLEILKKEYSAATLARLRAAAAKIDWQSDVSLAEPRAYSLGENDEDPVLVTEKFSAINPEELVDVILGIRTDKEVDEILAKVPASITNSSVMAALRMANNGTHPKLISFLVMIEGEVQILKYQTDLLRDAKSGVLSEWIPISKPTPLVIYWTSSMPENWCGHKKGFLSAKHSAYCPSQHSVFVNAGPDAGVDKRTVSSLNDLFPVESDLYHEVAHAYLNPPKADMMPFVTEGIVTAIGENILRSTNASVRFFAKQQFSQMALNLEKIESHMRANAFSPQKDEPSDFEHADDNYEIVLQAIKQTPFTEQMNKNLCILAAKPIKAYDLKRFLSMDAAFFSGLGSKQRGRAYAYGWAIFYYGVDIGKTASRIEDNQLDASVVQTVSLKLSQKLSVDAVTESALEAFVYGINKRVTREIAERGVICAKN